jgi:short-subunit dehydrogenase
MNVLITGAAGGLGRAFAIDCAERGYDLLLTDRNENGLLLAKQGIIRQFDVIVRTKTCDITKDDEVLALMDFAKAQDIRLDMLLNVAGIDHEGGFTQRSFAQISSILRVNIEATLRMTYRSLEIRRQNSRFYIIFVSSLASMVPMPLKATYAASKRFLLDFSIALRQELKSQAVSVLSLCPGGLATTDDAMTGITAQGFWGSMTTNRLEKVAHDTISKVMKGQAVYIPGLLNRTFSIFGKIIPAGLIARLIYGRWEKAQRQWLVNE